MVVDWNGDGHLKAGVYRVRFFCLNVNNNSVWDEPAGGDAFIGIGAQAGDIRVVGDWNSNGGTKAGVFRRGSFILDTGDQVIGIGGYPGEQPVVGDWNGDKKSKIGVFSGGFWILDYNGNGTWDNVAGADRFYGIGATRARRRWSAIGTGAELPRSGSIYEELWILD